MVKVLCYKSEGRWFDPSWCYCNFSLTKSFRSYYGPGVDSAANRNEYQEYFLGVKSGRCVRLTTLPLSCAVVMKSGNLNFLEPSGPLQACNGTDLPLPLPFTLSVLFYFALLPFRILFDAIDFGKTLVATRVKSLGKILLFMSSFNKIFNMKRNIRKTCKYRVPKNLPLVAAADGHGVELSVFLQLIVASAPDCALETRLPAGEARTCCRIFVTFCKAGDTNGRCR